MKRLALFLFAFIAGALSAAAHDFAPPTLQYVAASDSVYLVKAVSIAPGPDSVHLAKVTFVVIEVLKGPKQSKFELEQFESDPDKKGSEWIIIHNPTGFKDCVGWAMEGNCEWLPIAITRNGDSVTAQWLGPLNKVREYLHQHPKKT